MTRGLDLLLVSPGNPRAIYQTLAADHAAIETPLWAGMLAAAARARGYRVALADQVAEGLEPEAIAARAQELAPRLIGIVTYGQQPSASTQNMTMAETIADTLHTAVPEMKTVMLGGHVSALPERTLAECACDFVCQGEGPHTLDALLQVNDLDDPALLARVPGLWYRSNVKPVFTAPAPLITQEDLGRVIPGVAYDLMPMSVYRAHNWHCFQHIHERQPYASIYTSLGCPFSCSFCCINAPFGRAGIRYWDADLIAAQLDLLATRYGVKNVKIADEMFVLNEKRVTALCDRIIALGHEFNFWAYARVDSVPDRLLEKLKRAGVNWLCLGIESGSKHVRDGVSKGRFGREDIVATVRRIQDAGIAVIGNYIFGLPDDDYDSMQATLDLAVELNCEMANFYSGMAYPGSALYRLAVERNWPLPARWQDFSQHAYEQLPLPTDHLSAGEVLSFRDRAWQVYFTNPGYLDMIRRKYGDEVVAHIAQLTTHTLKRKYAAPLKHEPRLPRFEKGAASA